MGFLGAAGAGASSSEASESNSSSSELELSESLSPWVRKKRDMIQSVGDAAQPLAILSPPFTMLAARRVAAAASRVPLQQQRNASLIASKYAQALFGAASKNAQTLNKVQSELTSISNNLREVPTLSAFVSNPTLSASDRKSGLDAIYAAAAPKGSKEPVTPITKNLFEVLSENGRLGETNDVISSFNELVSKHKGELEVVVTSAAPLEKGMLSKLETTLKSSQAASQAKSVRVTNKVNPSILGGLLVDFGDKTIDLSVSSKVNRLNALLQLTGHAHPFRITTPPTSWPRLYPMITFPLSGGCSVAPSKKGICTLKKCRYSHRAYLTIDQPLGNPGTMSTFIEMNLAVYRTERRSKTIKDESVDWVPYYVLAYGTLAETNEVLSPVVGTVTLTKPQRNPNKKRDCTFRITFEGGDHTFRGVLQDDRGEWEWKGVYLCNQQKTHLKSYAPQVPYSHSFYEIKKHSPADSDSPASSRSSSDFKTGSFVHTRGSGGGSYACSIRTSVYGVIPLIEEPDDEPSTQAITPNKYDALIKEWSSISTATATMIYAHAEKKNALDTSPTSMTTDSKRLTIPTSWPHNPLSIPSPVRSKSRMKLLTTGFDNPNALQIPRSFTPFTEASNDSFYSIDAEDIQMSSSACTDSGVTVQGTVRDQSTPCPPTPYIPEIPSQSDPDDDYVVLYRACGQHSRLNANDGRTDKTHRIKGGVGECVVMTWFTTQGSVPCWQRTSMIWSLIMNTNCL
ncbi:ATP synthase subunit 5 [Rhizoctonia solani AG-1 IA]|uniref:ATP synthase subunit 5, mitochondrial n=1 Tax=Thanatephorus cucumeris (strain AG1-IA) TaxID=983506 RepID=L8WSH2_THACA|nr:ATP synthase subunit 5 [Rhizoctonia solani AG-1 IA]